MTPQELKNSILQMAIQGKLVPQDPSEGTGEDLYKQIQAEKAKLIKEGKIKKEKPLPVIAEEEKTFDIPESWIWVRLGFLLQVIGGVSYDKKDVTTTGYRILRGGNINNMKILLNEDDVFLPEQYKDEDKAVRIGDIIIVASTGSKAVIGKAGFVDATIPQTMIGAFLRICRPYSFSLVEFLRIIFASDFYRKHIRNLSQGTNINNVKESYITEFAIPLPPLAEQKRIVAKIEELLPLIDRYEEAWTKLEDFNKRFPGDMQKSILQMAIQGKLVEQRPEEGTGEELYKQIQAEKAELIKEGKIKKEKPLPEITEDEKPFDIPESWKWVRTGNIGSWSAGATPARTNTAYYGGSIPWLKTGDLNDGYVSEVPEYITELALKKNSVRLNPSGSVLMAMYGATIGKLGILTVPMTTNQACCACIPYCGLYNKYLFYFLMAQRTYFTKMGEGGAQPNISKDKIVNSLIPLPPLAEQKRIVAKLEEIMPLCQKLM